MVDHSKLLKSILSSKAKKWVKNSSINLDELEIIVTNSDIVEVINFFKTEKKYQFHMLISICAVDYPQRSDRFELVYNLLSLTHNYRIRIKTYSKENEFIPSISSLFKNAIWYEREVWDLFGVMFKGNPDLRRILTDYNFEGHPLRKDFPLSGNEEIRYDPKTQNIVHEKVHLTQAFRNFDFTSPWEGPNYVLPGDEKAE